LAEWSLNGTAVSNGNSAGATPLGSANPRFPDASSSRFESVGARRGQFMLAAVCRFWMSLPPQLAGAPSTSLAAVAANRRLGEGGGGSPDGKSVFSPSGFVDVPFVLPSLELVTLVRIAVKHVHYFINSLPPNAIPSKVAENVRRYVSPYYFHVATFRCFELLLLSAITLSLLA
jgi:hypothetical protein